MTPDPLISAAWEVAVAAAERCAAAGLSDPNVSAATKAGLRSALLKLNLARLEELDGLLGSLTARRTDTKGTPNV